MRRCPLDVSTPQMCGARLFDVRVILLQRYKVLPACLPDFGSLPALPRVHGGARFWFQNGRSPLVNACVRTLHTLSQPRRASIAAEHAVPALLEVASVEDSVQNRDGRPASDPPRRGNSSAPQIRQIFQAADGGDLVGHHLVALNSWDASTVQPKRFLRRRPSLPTTRMRRWLCWGSSATHRPWHTPEAGTVHSFMH